MNIPHQYVADVLKEVSEQIILPGRAGLLEEDILTKSKGEVVTKIDTESEAFLSRKLTQILPGSKVVGEEGVHANPESINALQLLDPVWVIDPLDGTKNFVSGSGPFAVMVCLICQGETLAAWIYDPIEKTLTSAEKSCGAFQGETKLKVDTSERQLGDLVGALRTRFLPDDLRTDAEKSIPQFKATSSSMSAGYDYPALVKNELNFLFYYRTLVWDHAPGALITQEAGGIVRRLDGAHYSPIDDKKGLLCTPSQQIWNDVQAVVAPSIEVSKHED